MKTKLIIYLLITLLILTPVLANEIQVGTYILNLGKFDIATGSFTADFYLDLKCSETCPETFEFMNGRASTTEKIIDEENEKFYRIQANLNSPIDLKKFPFDSQKMQIILEDKKQTVEGLTYIPLKEESGIDSSIAFSGWNIDGWDAEIKEHNYPVYDETYSQYIFSVNISRIYLNSFIKTFLPIIFILLVVLSSFIIEPDKVASRLAMVGSGLVASVMFHISISNQIPPVGYLTFADKFMMLTYFILLISFALNVVIMELQFFKKEDLIKKIHTSTKYSVFFIMPVLYLILFLFFI